MSETSLNDRVRKVLADAGKAMSVDEVHEELNPEGTPDYQYVAKGPIVKALGEIGAVQDNDRWVLPAKTFEAREAERRQLVAAVAAALGVLLLEETPQGHEGLLSAGASNAALELLERAEVVERDEDAADTEEAETGVRAAFYLLIHRDRIAAAYAEKLVPPLAPEADELRTVIEKRGKLLGELRGGPGNALQLVETIKLNAGNTEPPTEAEVATCELDLEALRAAGALVRDEGGLYDLAPSTQGRMLDLGALALVESLLPSAALGPVPALTAPSVAAETAFAEKERVYQAEIKALREELQKREETKNRPTRHEFEWRHGWSVKAGDNDSRLRVVGRIGDYLLIRKAELLELEEEGKAKKKDYAARAELIQREIKDLEDAQRSPLFWEERCMVYAKLTGDEIVFCDARTDSVVARQKIADAKPEHIAKAEREEAAHAFASTATSSPAAGDAPKPAAGPKAVEAVEKLVDTLEAHGTRIVVPEDGDEDGEDQDEEAEDDESEEAASTTPEPRAKFNGTFGAKEARNALLLVVQQRPDGVTESELADVVERTLKNAGREEPLGPMQRELLTTVASNAVKAGDVVRTERDGLVLYQHPRHAKPGTAKTESKANGAAKAASTTPAERITEYLRGKTTPQTKGEIVKGCPGLNDGGFDDGIKALKERGAIKQEGQRRSARYSLV